MMHPLQASWDRTAGHLSDAERALGGAPHPALAEYRHFLAHNELGLAMESLEAAGDALGAPPGFWRALRAAAEEMGLAERSRVYAARIRGEPPGAGS